MEAFKPGKRDNEAARKLKENGPPCSKCKPEIMPDNATACELFRRCITADGIRIESLEAAMRIFSIKQIDRADIADKVLLMAGRTAKQLSIKRKAEMEQMKNSRGGQRKFQR